MHRLPLTGDLSSRTRQKSAVVGLLAATLIAGATTSQAGTATFDFETDPLAQGLTITTSHDAAWVTTGGNPGGFLALTYSENSQSGVVTFPDIDAGKLVKAFRFEADVRAGNSQGDRPADGFAISFARSGDRFFNDGSFAVGGPPEFGTETGLAICFDTWAGNNELPGGDIEGLIVRVDNVSISKTDLPVRNGACDDLNSLQTGLRDAAFWTDFAADPDNNSPRSPAAWDTLCWQKVVADLDETGKLTVTWKGRAVLSNFQTTYFPSASRLVLSGRTGGANEQTHFDNIKLTTIPASQPILSQASGDACGVSFQIADAGAISVNQSSVTVTMNGTPVTPSVSYTAPNTTITVTPATPLPLGSTNTFVINYTSTDGTPSGALTRTYVVPATALVPAAAATTQFTAASSGFTYRIHQLATGRGPGDANFVEQGENQAAGGFLEVNGTPRANVAEPSAANGIVELINWEQNGGDLAGNPDNFNSVEPEAAPQANSTIPGIPGIEEVPDTDNVVAEILTFLELKRGCHVLGVNSDDGFLVTLGHSPFSPVLGQFSGGRGASDTTFRLFVEQDGVYPVRLLWWEGGGGANVEFFSVVGTNKYLINDRSQTAAIKAYSQGSTPGYLDSLAPANNWNGANPTGPVVVTFTNGLTSLNQASVILNVDGTVVTPAPQVSGGTVTYRFAPTTPWAFGSAHTGSVVYAFGAGTTVTQAFRFGVRSQTLADFGPGGFAIEAEHFDYNSGQHITTVDTMPYIGDEYDTLGAVRDTDYRAPDNGPFNAAGGPDGYAYRTGIPAEPAPSVNRFVPMDAQTAAGTLDTTRPGGWEVTTNYKIGWVGDEWYNYTRVVTNGNYKIIGVQSHGNAAGDPNRLRARFGVVLAGAGTPTQTVVEVGSYSRPATGGWGENAISVAQQGGQDTVINFGGTAAGTSTQTLRVWADEGDFDWWALIPTTEPTPAPSVTSSSPLNGAYTVADALTFGITDVLRQHKINLSSVALTVNGANVTSAAQITDTAAGVDVRYAPAGGFAANTYNYTLTFTDTSGATRTHTGSFISVNSPNVFVIEAEDLNHGSGQTVAAASTMPLQQGLYNGLGAVEGVDYNVIDDQAGEATYRVGETAGANIPMNGGGDPDRGPFNVTPSYKIGWTSGGATPEWFNYTRTFPAGTYNVYAALSHGGGGPTAGSLQTVADATVTNQTLTEQGTFNIAGGTGGWGVNRLVPLISGGNLASVSLSGTQTVRMTMASDADFDYLLFVPAGGPPPGATITSVTRSGGNITINWTGGGRLFSAPALNADGSATWTLVAGQTATSATVPVSGNAQFFMVRP
ncbi:MAG TPA: hypothetical protein VF773_08885 [Verrucomicrobiae bacterium]